MFHLVTDIPDWNLCESGLDWNVNREITSEELVKMQSCSPSRYRHQIQTPILFLLGAKDFRVPHQPVRIMHYFPQRLSLNYVTKREEILPV